ncbi:MAG: sterol desaturase family protein [Alphaproteobacteria bacterium]|nr:sterol desaturase family protein [Alphaproteobacteria bacterium]
MTLIDLINKREYREIFVFITLVIIMFIEFSNPVIMFYYNRFHHFKVNIFFHFTKLLLGMAFASFMLYLVNFCQINHIGILQYFQFPVWLQTLITVMMLDFLAAYFIHWAQHQVSWLWKIHIIHHTDTKVDVTTSNRHHPLEDMLRLLMTLLTIMILGCQLWMVALYQVLSILMSQYNHSNIKYPNKLDKFLSYLVVTPGMHKVHHHFLMPYTNSNYSNIFSCWDRIFGTYKFLPISKIKFGIDCEKEDIDEDIMYHLKLPFTHKS